MSTREYNNENDNSNVIYFNYNNYKFLFMGDAGIKKEMDIIDKYNLSNIDFLKQIPSNLKNKIELLCNAICIPNCPNRINHYKINSEYALSYGKPYTLNCKAVKSVNSPEVIAYKNTVTLDDIYNLYYPLGIE